MDTKYIRNSFRLLYGMLLLTVIYSCANIGSPNGGPYDETPPKFVSSTPVPNQINYTGKKIEILFDELIQIEKPSENVIITPPQMELPVIRSAGKKAVIELKDTLKPNTTYTIDFTNSISDNNEKNVFENFSFAFSTGDIIDTLEVSGVLLNAENLEPMPGITIGLHNNLEDSAFVKLPFVRTSRTNDKGQFTIRNITPGTTYFSLILAYMLVAVPFIIWIMVPHFENLPKDLEQAAMIDGCTANQIFFRVMLPLVTPGLITAALMSFIYSWNNFLFALVLSGYNTKTLPMAVFNFIGYAKISWGPLMAAATIITGPVVLISPIMQKYVVSGMTAGAVKG